MTDQPQVPAVIPPSTPAISFGQDHLDATDFIPPRVKVLQQMSQETIDKLGETGEFWDTLRNMNYGNKLRFIPLTTFKNRVLIVRSERRDEINKELKAGGVKEVITGDGLQCRSLDMVKGVGIPGMACAECPLAVWRGDEPPRCSETYNVSALTELGDLIIMSFAKSGAKTGKKLLSAMRMSRQKPWTQVFEASTRMMQNDRGSFAVPDVRMTGDQTPDELMPTAQEWLHELTGRVIDVTPPDEDDDSGVPREGEAPF